MLAGDWRCFAVLGDAWESDARCHSRCCCCNCCSCWFILLFVLRCVLLCVLLLFALRIALALAPAGALLPRRPPNPESWVLDKGNGARQGRIWVFTTQGMRGVVSREPIQIGLTDHRYLMLSTTMDRPTQPQAVHNAHKHTCTRTNAHIRIGIARTFADESKRKRKRAHTHSCAITQLWGAQV